MTLRVPVAATLLLTLSPAALALVSASNTPQATRPAFSYFT